MDSAYAVWSFFVCSLGLWGMQLVASLCAAFGGRNRWNAQCHKAGLLLKNTNKENFVLCLFLFVEINAYLCTRNQAMMVP